MILIAILLLLGPDDMMKLPNTCPLSQMYHMSQMSKLTNPDQG